MIVGPIPITVGTWRFPAIPEKDANGIYPNENEGRHVFRYQDKEKICQRRCIHCGLWETDASREVKCDSRKWKGLLP